MSLVYNLKSAKRNLLLSFTLWFLALGFILLFAWSAFHTIAQTTQSTGAVISNSQIQVIRVPLEGVLASMRVGEGELILEGQVVALVERHGFEAISKAITRPSQPDPLKVSVIRSPVSGMVTNIWSGSPGDVLRTGDELMQVVPLADKLIIEAKVHQDDIGTIHSGLPASVQFDPFNSATSGAVQGIVTYVSTDIIQENGRGKEQNYYRVHVEMDSGLIQTKTGKLLEILPGMVSKVAIYTGEETVLAACFASLQKICSLPLGER